MCWKAQGRKQQEEIGIVLFDNKKHLFVFVPVVDTFTSSFFFFFFLFHDGCSLMNCRN
jgi:hypothetical protein